MAEVLGPEGLTRPSLPPFVTECVTDVDDDLWSDWSWRSHTDVDPWWCYFGAGEGIGPESTRLDTVEGDFFLFAHRGHGANSFGLGLVARLGRLLIDQQVGWGGAFMDSAAATSAVNRATEVWNERLPRLLRLSDGDTDDAYVHVRYSDYRGGRRVDVVTADGAVLAAGDPMVPASLAEVVEEAEDYLLDLTRDGATGTLESVSEGGRGVLASSAVFGLFRAPGEAALVAHDGEIASITADEEPTENVEFLRNTFVRSSPAGVYRRLMSGDDWPGWAVTKLDLADYLVLLLGLSADAARFSVATQAQMIADVWNGCGPLAVQLGSAEEDHQFAEYLPGVVGPDASPDNLPAVGPSTIPGGFSPWRLALPWTDPWREGDGGAGSAFSVAAGNVLSHVVFAGLEWRHDPDSQPLLDRVQAEIDAIDPAMGALAFLADVRRIQGLATSWYLDGLRAEVDAAQRAERLQRRRAQIGKNPRRGGPVTRFRQWLANQIRKLG